MREPTIKGNSASEPGRSRRDGSGHGQEATKAELADTVDKKLRPERLSEIIGQRAVAERLAISLAAARKRGEPLPHILFDGPPGLGKTTFATVLHNELGVELNITSGAALDKKMDVMPFLTNAAEGSILFIDEIHRLPRAVEEFIYPVMEDFRVDVVLGEGMSARTINLSLKKFTIIGATTRSGMLSGPLRERFGMHEHLEFYDTDELARIITINAAKLNSTLVAEAAYELAARVAERLASPTRACAGFATTPWPAPTAISACRSPAMHSTCRRSIPRDWTSKTAATSKRSSASSRAAPRAWAAWRPR